MRIAVRVGDAQRAILRRAGEGGEVKRLTRAVDDLCRRPVVVFNVQTVVGFAAAAGEQDDEQQQQ